MYITDSGSRQTSRFFIVITQKGLKRVWYIYTLIILWSSFKFHTCVSSRNSAVTEQTTSNIVCILFNMCIVTCFEYTMRAPRQQKTITTMTTTTAEKKKNVRKGRARRASDVHYAYTHTHTHICMFHRRMILNVFFRFLVHLSVASCGIHIQVLCTRVI